MGHGLGFLSNDAYDSYLGYGSIEQPTPFDAYAQTADGRRLADLPSPSLELGKALRSTACLVWRTRYCRQQRRETNSLHSKHV